MKPVLLVSSILSILIMGLWKLWTNNSDLHFIPGFPSQIRFRRHSSSNKWDQYPLRKFSMKLIHNIFKPLRAIRCEMQWNAITLSLCPSPNHIWQVVLIHIEIKVKTVKENLFFFDRFSYETLIFLKKDKNWHTRSSCRYFVGHPHWKCP